MALPKNQVRTPNTLNQHEHEDDADAKRVTLVDQDGDFLDNDNPQPTLTSFLRDGSAIQVSEDTANPLNNRPLPVKLTSFSGDIAISAGNLNLETQQRGEYNASTNDDPDNVGLIVHERSIATDKTHQTRRPTAIRGTGLDDDTVSQDVALHDESGNRYSTTNPLKTRNTGKNPDNVDVDERINGILDSNSTSTLLGIGAEFTAPFENVENYSTASITVFADVPSGIDGLLFEVSTDGVNVDSSDEYTFLASGSSGKIYSVPLPTKFFRVRYKNGSIAQTAFRLQTKLFRETLKSSSHRISDTIVGEDDAELIKSVTTGRNPNNVFSNVPTGGVSDSNTTIIPLAASAIFTGAFINLEGYGGITISILTDQIGTLLIENSNDGSGIVDTHTFNVLAGDHFFIGVQSTNKFIRVRFANGPTIQTSMNLQTMAHSQPLSPSSQPINIQLEEDSVATTSRSVLTGEDSVLNAFNNVGVIGDRLKITSVLTNNIFYDDMNVSNGGVARETAIGGTFTQIYERLGSGSLLGFLLNLETIADAGANSWKIRLQVDGVELFGITGIDLADFLGVTVYNFTSDPTKNAEWFGISFKDSEFRWRGPLDQPVSYFTSIRVFIQKDGSSKNFNAGLVNLSKET